MGIQLYDSLLAQGVLKVQQQELALTTKGRSFIANFGIDIDQLELGRAVLCRECLDWSERRSHLAGSLGRAFFQRFEHLGWAEREEGTRVVTFTRKGTKSFDEVFAL